MWRHDWYAMHSRDAKLTCNPMQILNLPSRSPHFDQRNNEQQWKQWYGFDKEGTFSWLTDTRSRDNIRVGIRALQRWATALNKDGRHHLCFNQCMGLKSWVRPSRPWHTLHSKRSEKSGVDDMVASEKKLEKFMVTSREITKIRDTLQLLTSSSKHFKDSCTCVFGLNRSGRWSNQWCDWGLERLELV